jgi:uncharacterized protein HemX
MHWNRSTQAQIVPITAVNSQLTGNHTTTSLPSHPLQLSRNMSSGIIVGICVLIVAVLGIGAGLCVFGYRRKRLTQEKSKRIAAELMGVEKSTLELDCNEILEMGAGKQIVEIPGEGLLEIDGEQVKAELNADRENQLFELPAKPN